MVRVQAHGFCFFNTRPTMAVGLAIENFIPFEPYRQGMRKTYLPREEFDGFCQQYNGAIQNGVPFPTGQPGHNLFQSQIRPIGKACIPEILRIQLSLLFYFSKEHAVL